MKNLFIFLSTLLIIFDAKAQRQKVTHVDAPLMEYAVTLETEKAKISFNIEDLRAEWEATKDVLKSRGERYSNGVKGMEWLNNQRTIVNVMEPTNSEAMKQSDGALYLVTTLTHGIGAKLVRDGKAKVYRKDNATYQPEFEYKLLSAAPWSDVYGFYFNDGHDMFLKGEVVGEPNTVMPQEENEDDKGIFTRREVAPEYPNGQAKFQEYVRKNARYSPEAKKLKTSGKVFISFLVQKDGMLRDFKIQKGVNEEFNQEAIRLTRESGKWNPGMQNGKAVDVRYVLVITLDASGS